MYPLYWHVQKNLPPKCTHLYKMHVLPNIGSAHPGTVPEFSYTRFTLSTHNFQPISGQHCLLPHLGTSDIMNVNHDVLRSRSTATDNNNHTINRAAFVCLSVCLFVPYLLRGPLTDLRQTWWVYVGGPRNCPWGVLFRKGQRLDGSTGHFHFPLYYICASLTPHCCKRRLCCYCI